MTDTQNPTMCLFLERSSLSVGRARRAVHNFLGDEAPIPLVRDAMMLISELVTNAVLHTPAGCELSASFDRARQRIRVEIADSSPDIPTLGDSLPPDRSRSHGLRLVDHVATRWGATGTPRGKTIWFELMSSP